MEAGSGIGVRKRRRGRWRCWIGWRRIVGHAEQYDFSRPGGAGLGGRASALACVSLTCSFRWLSVIRAPREPGSIFAFLVE